MAELTNRRAKASTLLEVLVAMVIISTIVGIAMFVFINTGRGGSLQRKIAAEQILKAYATKTKANGQFFDADEHIDSFEVRRQVFHLNDFSKLWRVHFYIYDTRHILLSDWQQYILDEQ